jgi:hypothetical protein
VKQTPRSASVRGHERGSVKVMADLVSIYVGVGASDELSLIIRQYFKEGRYSPLTRMEEIVANKARAVCS